MSPEIRSGADEARPAPPDLRLDELFTELRGRLAAAPATRDRVHALLDAIVSIGGDLDIEIVLRRVAEAATTLVDARYGALGVIGEGDRPARFITAGATPERIDTVEDWPHRPGVLGVPIRVRGEAFGMLYLTEKAGGEEFDEDDENAVSALATAAAVAIENARLYQDARHRECWLRASAEVSTALLSGNEPGEVLDLVVRRARELCDADVAAVALVRGTPEEFVVEAADGRYADLLDRVRMPFGDAAATRVFRSGSSLTLSATEVRREGTPSRLRLGPVLIVPLGLDAVARGVLSVANAPGRPAFGEPVRRLLEGFAAQAAIGLELAERRRDAERLVVLEDRDRIAKDLHDTVIQRLFAIAMTLMTTVKIAEEGDVRSRVERAVDDLDETIRQIRSSIFALQATSGDERTLRSRLHGVIDDAADSLGFAPAVRLDGLLDTTVDGTTGDHLVAVLREALSNVARHARATRVDVAVTAGAELLLTVADDGVGISGTVRRSGLVNMAARAKSLGGTFGVRPRHGAGTTLEWRVPIGRAGAPPSTDARRVGRRLS